MIEQCSFIDFTPYALLFTGVGFAAAVVTIVILSRADAILDKMLTNGFFSGVHECSAS